MGAFMTLPLTFLAFFSHVEEHYGTYHGKLGLSVGAASLSQGILGTVLFGRCGFGPCSRETPSCCHLQPGSLRRRYVGRLHRLLGWLTILLAFVTIFFGLWAFSCEDVCEVVSDLSYLLFGYLAALVLPLFCLEVRHRKTKLIHVPVPQTPTSSIDGRQPLLVGSLSPLVASVDDEGKYEPTNS